jgi:hypothetical protein
MLGAKCQWHRASAAALILGREQDGVISEAPALQIRRGDCPADLNSFSEPVCSAALVRGSAEAAMPAPSILGMSRRVNFKSSFISLAPLVSKILDQNDAPFGVHAFSTRSEHVPPAGGSLKDVQELAGHSSLFTTQRYIQGDTEAKKLSARWSTFERHQTHARGFPARLVASTARDPDGPLREPDRSNTP